MAAERTTQCSILYVTVRDARSPVDGLRALGFRVDEVRELPANDALARYHALVFRADDCHLPMLAARLRAKPHFGRRIMVALVPSVMADRDKREAVHSGFDSTLPETCGVRDLAAAILRLLRPYPEFRCILRSPGGRKKAA